MEALLFPIAEIAERLLVRSDAHRFHHHGTGYWRSRDDVVEDVGAPGSNTL